MKKKRVEIINSHYNEVCDRLLLSEDQVKLLVYLMDMGYCDGDLLYHILEEADVFKEI